MRSRTCAVMTLAASLSLLLSNPLGTRAQLPRNSSSPLNWSRWKRAQVQGNSPGLDSPRASPVAVLWLLVPHWLPPLGVGTDVGHGRDWTMDASSNGRPKKYFMIVRIVVILLLLV